MSTTAKLSTLKAPTAASNGLRITSTASAAVKANPRPTLQLVHSAPVSHQHSVPKSRFAQMLDAYCDGIDRQILEVMRL